MAGTLLLARCSPYGAEEGGPRMVMGGLHGPGSARTPGMDLPENVAQGEWSCPQPAVVRVRMVCRCNHTGRIMNLCSWHDEIGYQADPLNWRRKVKVLYKVRGHYEEIQRRQAGACIRCLYPGKYAGYYKDIEAWQNELAYLRDLGAWYSRRGYEVRQKIEDLVASFDEGNARGTIHRCPMRLEPVS